MSIVASITVAIIALTMFYAPLKLHLIKEERYEATKRIMMMRQSLLRQNFLAQLDYECIPQNDGTIGVGGLQREDVPKLSDAMRLEYENNGSSEYSSALSEVEIFNYYLSKLSDKCWELAAINPHEMLWQKNDNALKIAVAENPYGGKSQIDYAVGSGMVLGVSFAQTTEGSAPPPPPPPSGDFGSMPPPPSDNFGNLPPPPSGDGQNFNGGYPPPPSENFGPNQGPQPYGQPSGQPYGDPSGQNANGYWCNGQQVSDGQPCNGYNPPNPRGGEYGNNGPYDQGRTGQGNMMGENKNFGLERGTQGGRTMNQGRGQGSNQQGYGTGKNMDGGQGQGQEGEEGFSENSDMMDEERLKQMKKGLSQFAKGVSQFQKMVNKMKPKLAKLGVGIPTELEAALAKAPEILDKIKNAQSADEVEDLMTDIQDIGDAMQEWGQKFGDLMRLGEMLKQADKGLKDIQKAIKRIQTSAKKNTAAQEIANNLNTMASEMSQILKDVRELAKTEPDSALEKLENDFFGKMEEFWNSVAEADTVINITKGISQAKKEIAKAKQKVKTLEKNKKIDPADITDLKDILANIEAQVKDLGEMAKQKASAEEIQDASGELWGLVEEFENKLAELGQGSYKPNVQQGENIDFHRPEGYDFGPRQGNQGFGSGSGEGGFGNQGGF